MPVEERSCSQSTEEIGAAVGEVISVLTFACDFGSCYQATCFHEGADVSLRSLQARGQTKWSNLAKLLTL